MPRPRSSKKTTKTKKRSAKPSAHTSSLPDPGFEMLALAALAIGLMGLAAVVALLSQYLGFLTA